MAETFLHELFQPSNLVQSDIQERKCDICLQETGNMSRQTGLVELLVRLPCSHMVGSGCIGVWLKDHNTCPLCRREFFPTQQQPYPEDDRMWDQGEEDTEEEDQEGHYDEEDEEVLQFLKTLCLDYCLQLDLDRKTIEVAEMIIQKLLSFYPFSQVASSMYDRNVVRIVGLAIFISSCLTDDPRSPREICRVEDADGDRVQDTFNINGDDIRAFYSMIYERREQLINDRILEALEGRDVVWPPFFAHDWPDNQIEYHRDQPRISTLCAKVCADLRVSSAVEDLAQHILANVLRAGFHTYSYPRSLRFISDLEVTAVSIYTASHLVGRPITRRALQHLLADEDPDIRYTYRTLRYACSQLVREEFQETFEVPLSWETLEAEVGELNDGVTAAHREAMPNISTATDRLGQLKDHCNGYCSRLVDQIDPQTLVVAQELAERFCSTWTAISRCPKSTAAICVYFAAQFTGNTIDYTLLGAATNVDLSSIHCTHVMIIQEIHMGRAYIEDIIVSSTYGSMNSILPTSDS